MTNISPTERQQTPYEQWKQANMNDIEEAKMDPRNIRYYKGKYRVIILPNSKDAFPKNYRCVAALEKFPHDELKMMIQENDLFATTTRWLSLTKEA
jgi:hypothetical protein